MRNNVYFWYILGGYKAYVYITLYLEKKENFLNFMYNDICTKLWGDDITNSLISIFIRTGQEMFFRKNLKFQNVTTSLFLIWIFIMFAPICREIFMLSFENYDDSGLDFPFKGPMECNCMLTCVDFIMYTLIITNVAKRLFKYVPYMLLYFFC